MKKAGIIVVVLLLALVSKLVFAAEGGKKGASARAYERASEQAIFHRVSDWFSTIGKSAEEKAKILEERRAERAARKAEKEAEKAQRKIEQTKQKLHKKLDKD